VTRDPEALTRRHWDLLVVGGGIHGLFAAYDAAQRGLAVALIEAEDFGSGVSFNHQRTLHGGLRALQAVRIGKVREQIAERRAWARIAPHLVRPLPFLIGTYGRGMRSRLAVRTGFRAYDVLARRRNDGVSAELHLPRTRMESRAATRKLFPRIAEAGLTGGAIWYDYQTTHPDRLTWLVAQAATNAGATLVNYMRAATPLRASGRVTGVRAVDAIDGHEADIEASMVLLAAGAGLPALHQQFGVSDPPPLLRALNLLLDRPARDIALAARAPSGSMLTVVPWRGAALVGTYQSRDFVADGASKPSGAEIDGFVEDVRGAFPVLEPDRQAIRMVHYGLVPGMRRGGRADLLSEALIISHGRAGTPGLISLVGVKYTTARLAAQRAVDGVCTELGRAGRSCRTARTLLPAAGISDVEGLLVEAQRRLGIDVEPATARHLADWYGSEASAVLAHAAEAGGLETMPGAPMLSGEISYAIQHEAAQRLSDVVLRRTPLGSAGHPGRAALDRTADRMARALGWNADRVADEIARVEDRYTH
jgi:glycerol-3-phosphate dehydrogenase